MTIINRIMEAIQSDDCDQSERLITTYEDASLEGRAAIDDALICVCGWSLPTLIAREQAEEEGEAEGEVNPVANLAGSHGETSFDIVSGVLMEPYGDAGNPEDSPLVRVDVEELRLAYGSEHPRAGFHYDVLELAGWSQDGRYGGAEGTWRDEWVREALADPERREPHHLVTAHHYDTIGREAVKQLKR